MATPILCQGTTITIADGTGTATTIGGVVSISGVGAGSASEIPATTLASTAKEFKMGLQDFGSMTMELIRNNDDAGQVQLQAAMAAQAKRQVVITLPTSTLNVATFDGYVMELGLDVNADGIATGKCVIRVTGAIVWS
jgi:hypothetical protein